MRPARRGGPDHPLVHALLKAVELGASRQGGATLSPTEVKPITIASAALVDVVNHRVSTNMTADSLGLLLSGEPATSGGGIHESAEWIWDLTQYRPLQPFVSADARDYLVQLDSLLASQTPRPFTAFSPETLPRALDHLNVIWKVVAGQRLFYPRGLASAASLVEPVNSGDQLTARLGALADVFDLVPAPHNGQPTSRRFH